MAASSAEDIRRNRGAFPFSNQRSMPVRLGQLRNSVIRLIYNLLWPIGLLVFLPGYLVKMFRRGGYRRKFGQRFGIYDAPLRARLHGKKLLCILALRSGVDKSVR